MDNVVWACYGTSFSIYGTSYIPDLFTHLKKLESILMSRDSLKRKYYLFRKQKLAGGGININSHRGGMNSLLSATQKTAAILLINNIEYIPNMETYILTMNVNAMHKSHMCIQDCTCEICFHFNHTMAKLH